MCPRIASTSASSQSSFPVLRNEAVTKLVRAAGAVISLMDSCGCLTFQAKVVRVPASSRVREVDRMLSSMLSHQEMITFQNFHSSVRSFAGDVVFVDITKLCQVLSHLHDVTHPQFRLYSNLSEPWRFRQHLQLAYFPLGGVRLQPRALQELSLLMSMRPSGQSSTKCRREWP